MTMALRRMAPPVPARDAAPSRALQFANFVVFQLAWFACVLGGAHGMSLWGTACVAGAIGWHLAVSTRPDDEARLLGCVLAIGAAFETAMLATGSVQYPPQGQPVAALPPYWLVAMWGLLAIALNVTMRWLKPRLLLAALLGAVAGPMSFAAGVRLGAATVVQPQTAYPLLAFAWALLLPALLALARRFDGVSRISGVARPAP